MKVLAIGNSFSVDAMEWLYNIAASGNEGPIALGNLRIPGCSLETHLDKALGDRADYIFYTNTGGVWNQEPDRTMLYGISYADWDIITMQQASALSGIESSYEPYLSKLIGYVNRHRTNPSARLAWHMTWAYQHDSVQEKFASYHRDQMIMYKGIVRAVKSNIVRNSAFSFVIPVGTAIQNVRTSYIGDTLTRDGFHLSYSLGRYIAGMTWFRKISGLSLEPVNYVPDMGITREYRAIVKEAVENAVKDPFRVTESRFREA
jgi:hypothetical protein